LRTAHRLFLGNAPRPAGLIASAGLAYAT